MNPALEQAQMIEPWPGRNCSSGALSPESGRRHDPPAACIHCIYHRIADAVEVWAQLSLPTDRDAAWAHVSDLLNLKNTPPENQDHKG